MARHGVRYGLFRPVAGHAPGQRGDRAKFSPCVGLEARADDMAGDLTYSEQRALEIGMTLTTGADVILLDEPTAGMSREETAHAVELIRDVTKGKTLLMVEHDMSVVFSLCDRVSVLVYGKILATDTPETHQRQPRGAGSLSRRGGGVMSLLEVRGLHAHYGKSHILHGVDLTRSGCGHRLPARAQRLGPLDHAARRSWGWCRRRPARCVSPGATSPAAGPSTSAAQGIGFVPEERLVFPNLTVEENLLMGVQKPAPGAPRLDHRGDVRLFPAPEGAPRASAPAICRAASSRC